MHMLEIQKLFTDIKEILTEYEDGLKNLAQKADVKQLVADSVNNEKQAEFEKIEKMLNAAYHIAMDVNASVTPVEAEVEPIPFDQMTLSRHIYACNNQDGDSSRVVSEILHLIKGNRLWLAEQKKVHTVDKNDDKVSLGSKEDLKNSAMEALKQLVNTADKKVLLESMGRYKKENSIESVSTTVCGDVLLGLKKEMSVPAEFYAFFQYFFSDFFIEKDLYSPILLDIKNNVNLCIDAETERIKEAKDIVLLLLYNMFRHYPERSFKVRVVDPLKFSEYTVGELQPLIQKDGFLVSVPHNHSEILSELQAIVDGGEAAEKAQQVLVLFHFPEKYESREIQLIQQLEANQQEYGISLILLHESKEEQDFYTSEKKTEHYIRRVDYKINLRREDTYLATDDVETNAHFEKMENGYETLIKHVIDKCKERYEAIPISNKYHELFDLFELPLLRKREIDKIPFGIDEKGNVAYCSFEDENFAAYISGAARSGKSTCLHALISGIIRNYHPDVAELWLLDFKMLEFRDYASCNTPHIKYLLLEKSEELIADILKKATEELNRRQNIFNRYGFKRLSDVPMDIYMPSVFLIIDEFAQVSQIIKKMTLEGSEDYTIMLENLLAKGAALGFKFIFADQGFVDGVSGLTEKARHQMQMRFAFKNTDMEIKATLEAQAELLTERVVSEMHNLQPHYVLYKSRDEHGYFHINKYLGLYLSQDERVSMLNRIADSVTEMRAKEPVIVTGGEPKAYERQRGEFAKAKMQYELEEGEEGVLVFAGSPLNMEKTAPFPIWDGVGENILLVNGDMDSQASVISSVAQSLSDCGYQIELHSYSRNRTCRMKQQYLNDYWVNTDVNAFCCRMQELLDRPQKNRLVILMGLDYLLEEAEVLSQLPQSEVKKEAERKVDLFSQLQLLKSGEKKVSDIPQLNAELEAADRNKNKGITMRAKHIREDIKQLLILGPKAGLHFLLVADDAEAFTRCSLDKKMFRHKLVFRTDANSSYELLGNRKAAELENGNFLYVQAQNMRLLRPYLYQGMTIDGWKYQDNGTIELT